MFSLNVKLESDTTHYHSLATQRTVEWLQQDKQCAVIQVEH